VGHLSIELGIKGGGEYLTGVCWRFKVRLFLYRPMVKGCVLAIFTSFVLMVGSVVVASESELAPKFSSPNLDQSDLSDLTPIALSVRGASAGVTVDYYEQTVIDAINASEIFSSGDNQDYSLEIRIIKVVTPSFSTNMTVSMKTIWKFSHTAQRAPLLEESILSTYTGGVFEGGISGANRVRVALEGAARENIRIGIELLAALHLER